MNETREIIYAEDTATSMKYKLTITTIPVQKQNIVWKHKKSTKNQR